VGEKEREFVPVGVKTDVAKDKETEAQQKTATAKADSATPEPAKGTVNISSNPPGADVNLDGEFVGGSPATLTLLPGKHTVMVKISGYKDCSREITVQSGSEMQLTVNLEK